MYSLHDSGAVIFRYCQIRDTCKQAGKQLQTLIVTCRKSLKELISQIWGVYVGQWHVRCIYSLLDGSLFVVKYLQLPQILLLLVTRSAPDSSTVTGHEEGPASASAWRIWSCWLPQSNVEPEHPTTGCSSPHCRVLKMPYFRHWVAQVSLRLRGWMLLRWKMIAAVV